VKSAKSADESGIRSFYHNDTTAQREFGESGISTPRHEGTKDWSEEAIVIPIWISNTKYTRFRLDSSGLRMIVAVLRFFTG
jgi:hypothetical protein